MPTLAGLERLLLNYQPTCPQEEADRQIMLELLSQGDCLLRSNRLAHFTASSWILDETGRDCVLVYHSTYDSWSWTGGHADGDSDLLAVSLKEAREETGLQKLEALSSAPISLEILTVEGHMKKGQYVPAHLHMNLTFLLRADKEQALRACPGENLAVRWFPRAEAPAASSEPKMRPIYEKLNRQADRLLGWA